MELQTEQEVRNHLLAQYEREYETHWPDLFGEPIPEKISGQVEKFSVESDLVESERQITADEMYKQADRLLSAGSIDGKKANRIRDEADRFAQCGHIGLSFYCRECHSRHGIKQACRSRLCERCARGYAKRLEKRLMPVVRKALANKPKGYVLALLTLTVTSKRFGEAMPSRADLQRLYRETSEMLRMNYGKYAGRRSKSGKVYPDRNRWLGAGWAATLEFGSDNNNAHCHVLVYGPIRQWYKLKTAWEAITKDSRGVDIRAVRNPVQAVKYVLKYIAKPPRTDSYGRLAEYAIAIKGTRRLRTGGIFYRLKPHEKIGLSRLCTICGGLLVLEGLVPWPAENHVDLGEIYRSFKNDA